MISWTRKAWNEEPLTIIMGLAIILRLAAIVFAKGWGMHDDHFLVIESAQSWVDGLDQTYWLPWNPRNHGPTGHLLLYPGLHFILFSFLELVGITDPQAKMFVVRLVHGAWSLVSVLFAYRIAMKFEGLKTARTVGLLMAVLWCIPWLSVRNLVEWACVPFLILAFWQMVKKDNPAHPFWIFFIAGVLFGLAVDIRLQTCLFPLGAGLVLLYQRRWKEFTALTLGTLSAILFILGTFDMILWGYPLAELMQYIAGNIAQRNDYITLPWFQFFIVLTAALIPPISLFFLFGFFRTWKKQTLLFVPALLFLIFHSYFPNKQERFILPLIPFFIILGVIGWNQFAERSKFWKNHRKLLQGCWTFFWVINLLFLPVITVNYSKKARVETMNYLSKYPNINHMLVADDDNRPELFPRFYVHQWPHIYCEFIDKEDTEEMILRVHDLPHSQHPRFILFSGIARLQERVMKTRESFPFIVYETTIEPGFIDWLVHWINPINQNNVITIYRNCEFFPERIE
ncbi:glycosyltransferase family 39 protein [Bacteroidota bacterium]